MTLSTLINPPQRVQLVLGGSAEVRETILFGALPAPNAATFTGNLPENVILQMDATPRQTHKIGQDIPLHPVEVGFEVTDDVQTRAKTLTLDCIISDIPPELLAAIGQPVADLISGNSRSSSAWTVLKGLVGEAVEGTTLQTAAFGVPFDVITSLDIYRNMLIQDVVVNRDKETSEALSFSINLREIRTVSSATSPSPSAPAGTSPDSDLGRTSTGPVSADNTTQAAGITAGVNQ